MARIRTIKPEFFTSLTIAGLTLEQRLTFIALWTHADDSGRMVDDARLVKAAAWPLDDRTAADVEVDLAALADAGLILRYALAESSVSPHGALKQRSFIAVTGWREHQKINRPTSSKLPAPEQGNPTPPKPTTSENNDSVSAHGELSEDSRQERKGKEQGNTPSLRSGAAPRKRATRIPDDFANLITPDLVQWAHDNTPQVDGRYETLQFVDYWTSQPDRTGKKTDWIATWRKWMRKAQKDITDRRSNTSQRNTITGSARADKARGFLAPNDPLLAEWGTPGNTTPTNPLSGFQPLVIEGGMTA